jgi:hypothetical protein
MSITFIEWLQTKNEQAGDIPLGNTLGQGQAANQPNPAGNQTPPPPPPSEDPKVSVEIFQKTLQTSITNLFKKLGTSVKSDATRKEFLKDIIVQLQKAFGLSDANVTKAVKDGRNQQQQPQQQPQQPPQQ